MKKWLIVLAISNVVTLIALSITITVLVMRDYLNTYDNAEKQLSQSDQEKANEQINQYKSAKNNENVSKNDDEDNDAKSSNEEKINSKPKKDPKKLTQEEYENTPFDKRWHLSIVSYDPKIPEKSLVTVANIFGRSEILDIGSKIEGYELFKISKKSVLFQDSYGAVVELRLEEFPEWAKIDESLNNKIDVRDEQDPDTGVIKTGSGNPKNKSDGNKTTSYVDTEGKVITAPKGVDTEKLLEKMRQKELEDMKKKEAEKSTQTDNTEKKEVIVSSEHHSFDPKEVYDIQENFGKYFNQAVIENSWDVKKGMFIGVSIVNFDEASMYAKLGFKKGDVVTHINGNEVASTYELENVLKTEDFTKGVQIQIIRDGKALKLVFDFSYDKVLEYEQKLREAYAKSGIDPEKSDDDK